MVGKLSAKIAEHLCDTAVITEEDKDLYSYGFFVILSRILFLIITTIFGIILHIAIESILFFVLFCLIRSYAGGVHASSEFKCTAYTTGALFICVLFIKFFKEHNLDYVTLILLIISSTCIFVLSPLDSPEKPLVKQEKIHFKKCSCIITCLIIVLAFTFYLLEMSNVSISCLISLVLESILLIAGKLKTYLLKIEIVN